MIAKAWSARGGFWTGEPHQVDGTPINSMRQLGAYVERSGHVLFYIWANGESQQRQEPKLLNVTFVEHWEECGFDEVIRNFPSPQFEVKRQRKRRRDRRRAQT